MISMNKKLPIIKYLFPVALFLLSTNAYAYTRLPLGNEIVAPVDVSVTWTDSIQTLNQNNQTNYDYYMANNYNDINYWTITTENDLEYINSECYSSTTVSAEYEFNLIDMGNPYYYDIQIVGYSDNLCANRSTNTPFYYLEVPSVPDEILFTIIQPMDNGSILRLLNRTDIDETNRNVASVLMAGTSNLWPIIILIVGLVYTFFIFDKIVGIFNKNLKTKNEYGGEHKHDDHGNLKSIVFDRKNK